MSGSPEKNCSCQTNVALVQVGTLEVRAEEALLVVLVLLLWVGAIVLFFNRWGKIRMLEPYQPKFHQEHRASCPVGDMTSVSQHRTSFSKYNVSLETPLLGPMPTAYRNLLRPRQNSVFVGSVIKLNPPRKTKSAIDLQSLVTNETSPGVSRSMLPMLSVERRPSSCIFSDRRREDQTSIELQSPATNDNSPGVPKGSLLPTLSVERRPSSCVFPGRRPSSAGYLSPRRPSVVHLSDLLPPGAFTGSRERRPSFNNVIAQVTAERRPSSSMLRIVNV
ncbi:hypothetical protein GE061_015494 [Apolygus lucorum]|uniref:Fibronectin type III domain-containing protein n=1 Tax=Apolygus lucorum TaxID=248454 RepID=A0A6A4J320_APOLU|nr:hypothetical protein GE061_015494 [Apolygus lucorum]